MKVLHVGNTGGVASVLIKGLRQRNVQADLIVRRRSSCCFPGEKVTNLSAISFLFYILKLSRDYDVIHIHGLPYRKLFYIHIFLLKILGKKVVIHLHGTEIRRRRNKPVTKLALKISDIVLVSTPDLLSYYEKAIWLPNPIDPQFRKLNRKRRGALYFPHWYEPESEEKVKEHCKNMGLDLTIQNKLVPYDQMPRFLNQFEVFFDRLTISSLSKTALEALACGCKVIGWKGLIRNREKIVKNHSLPIVTERLLRIYKTIYISLLERVEENNNKST